MHAGRTPCGNRIVTAPETMLTRTGPCAAEPIDTLPLTARTSTLPLTSFSDTRPDTVEISASRVVPTVIRPLLVDTLHCPRHSASSTDPETVRRSASVAEPTWIRPLTDVMPMAPTAPCSSTLPERVPIMTSAPAGHVISIESDGLRARTSTSPSAVALTEPFAPTAISAPDSALTVTRPGDGRDAQPDSCVGGRRHHGRRFSHRPFCP